MDDPRPNAPELELTAPPPGDADGSDALQLGPADLPAVPPAADDPFAMHLAKPAEPAAPPEPVKPPKPAKAVTAAANDSVVAALMGRPIGKPGKTTKTAKAEKAHVAVTGPTLVEPPAVAPSTIEAAAGPIVQAPPAAPRTGEALESITSGPTATQAMVVAPAPVEPPPGPVADASPGPLEPAVEPIPESFAVSLNPVDPAPLAMPFPAPAEAEAASDDEQAVASETVGGASTDEPVFLSSLPDTAVSTPAKTVAADPVELPPAAPPVVESASIDRLEPAAVPPAAPFFHTAIEPTAAPASPVTDEPAPARFVPAAPSNVSAAAAASVAPATPVDAAPPAPAARRPRPAKPTRALPVAPAWPTDETEPPAARPIFDAPVTAPVAASPVPDPVATGPTGAWWTIPLTFVGIAIVACAMLIPAADDNRRDGYELAKIERDVDYFQRQSAVNADFLRRVDTDPTLAERLALRQLHQTRVGVSLAPLAARPDRFGSSPYALTRVDPPAPLPPYAPTPGRLGEWFLGEKRPQQMAALGLLVAGAGVMIGGVPRRRRADPA